MDDQATHSSNAVDRNVAVNKQQSAMNDQQDANEQAGTAPNQTEARDAEQSLEELVEKLDNWLDPVNNPLFKRMFDVATVCIVMLMFVVVSEGYGNIHVYVLLSLTIGLFASVSFFLSELRKVTIAKRNEDALRDASGESEQSPQEQEPKKLR